MTEPEEDNKPAKETSKKPRDTYELKGLPILAYLVETGDFKWIPTCDACATKENSEKILEVLRKMPEDRRKVWAQRLDLEQAKITCPVIRRESDLCEEFDELCAAYKPPNRIKEKPEGGESQK